MKGLVIINAYPNGEKFIRQGERIAKELRLLGVETNLVKNGEIFAICQADGTISSNLADKYDFAVYLDKDKYLGKLLEKCGLRLFNNATAVELCDDKLLTYIALNKAGVSLVKSIPAPLCYTPNTRANEDFLYSVAQELGFPLIAKKSYGSFGCGVKRVHGMGELLSTEQEWLYLPHFYQSYVEESAGKDIRVIVIGGKAVGAMERVAQQGEFRSNIELGGTGRKMELSPQYAIVAEKAAKALGLDYCGVDLLEGKNGAVVCEVNSNAFFEGLEGVTGLNIAKLYAEHILRCFS